MLYNTTKIKPLKSYPTYQLHAYSRHKTKSVHDCFKICILETFSWLRSRLGEFDEVPQQLRTPEPDDLDNFPDSCLSSFTVNLGFAVSVTYIEKSGIWSFNISESDMGANMDSDNRRLPVQGRVFSTDISFRKLSDCVEIGIRTMCSEPSDTEADCEVFRPYIVKMLAADPNVGLRYSYPFDGQAVEISSKGDAEQLISVIKDEDFCLPVVIIAEAPAERKKEKIPALPDPMKLGNLPFTMFPAPAASKGMSDLTADISKVNINVKQPKKSAPAPKQEKRSAPKPEVMPTEKTPLKRCENIDCNYLAKSLIGFAVVCFVKESAFRIIRNKLGISIDEGDILVMLHENIVESCKYDKYRKDLKGTASALKKQIILLPKRRQINYGGICFSSDARLLEIEEKRSETLSRRELTELLMKENSELKTKISELIQQQEDNAQTSERFRIMQKKLSQSENEKEELQRELEKMQEIHATLAASYKASAVKTDFYRRKSIAAAGFPVDKDEVCSWVRENLGDDLIISQRAESELDKYSGAMDVSVLCDGLYYLSGYNKYRNGEITEEELSYYGEAGSWAAEGCGKEALRVRSSDYTVNHKGNKYTLDLHIKHGVKAQQLIRIYFCRLDDEKKLLIGYMPGHLATVRQNT